MKGDCVTRKLWSNLEFFNVENFIFFIKLLIQWREYIKFYHGFVIVSDRINSKMEIFQKLAE